MGSLGQSSIEYLTTYGWMALAVTLAGAALYPSVDRGCNVSIEESFAGSSIRIDQVGVTEDGEFQFRLNSESEQEIRIQSFNITQDGESQEVVKSQSIPPEAEATYSIGNVERTGSCQSYTMEMKFDKGPLSGQSKVIEIRGSLNLLETLTQLLKAFGDSITSIEIQASVQPTNDTICIGTECEEDSWETEDDYVSRSGDEMTGPLKLANIEATCYGENCPTTRGDSNRYVPLGTGVVEGTLNVTEIKPLTDPSDTITFR